MTNRKGRALAPVLLLTMTWCAWNESIAPRVVLTGAALAVLVLILTNRFFLGSPYHTVYSLSPLTLLRYLAVLTVEIFRSGAHAIYLAVTGRMHVGVVNLPTRISNPLHAVLVANAITLTPGTVTIEYTPGNFQVVWIEALTTDAEAASATIKSSFERVFDGGI